MALYHTGGALQLLLQLLAPVQGWAQGRAGAVVPPQPPGTALWPQERTENLVCLPRLHVCFVCSCLQYHSEQLTALCFNENVASWANLLAYSQMEIY